MGTAATRALVLDDAQALMEEAWRRAHQRRLRYCGAALVVALLIAATALVIGRQGSGGPPGAGSVSSIGLRHTHLALKRPPYMGVACPNAPNSIACDRVGLAVWLREPAVSLTATVSGRTVAMGVPSGMDCSPASNGPTCRTYFEGFLQPAGLRNGPLTVRPDRGRYHWIGTHATTGTVRLVAHYPHRPAASLVRKVALSPGWG